MTTETLQAQIAEQVAALSTEDQALVRDFVAYLHWRRRNPCEQDKSQEREWRYSFLEYFAEADVRAARDVKGMEVKAAVAAVNGVDRPALWQHPPYFHDGSAADLLAVVNHYDKHFGLKLTAAQKADLVEFLKSL